MHRKNVAQKSSLVISIQRKTEKQNEKKITTIIKNEKENTKQQDDRLQSVK